MIRRLLVLVLLTLYSASAIGVPLHYHYCKGELQHVSVFAQKDCDSHEQHNQETAKASLSCCLGVEADHCSLAQDPDCCNDELDLIQLDDEAAAILLPFSSDVDLFTTATAFELRPVVQRDNIVGYHVNAPPVKISKIYLSNCSFVFYG